MKEYISHTDNLYDHQLLYVIYLDCILSSLNSAKEKKPKCWLPEELY